MVRMTVGILASTRHPRGLRHAEWGLYRGQKAPLPHGRGSVKRCKRFPARNTYRNCGSHYTRL
jgi:hypothetical protein